METLSDKELDRKIHSFLARKNAEVFHVETKETDVVRYRPKQHFRSVRFA